MSTHTFTRTFCVFPRATRSHP